MLTLDEQVGARPLGHRTAIENETTIFGFNEAELSLNNRFERSRTAVSGERAAELGSEIEYRWRRPGYPRLPVFERMENKPYYRHTESVGVVLTYSERELERSELLVGHETALMIGEHGRISVFGDIGWLVDPGRYDDGSLQVIGLQVGLEGELRY